MNLTIVRADDLVIIDDKPQTFDLSPYSFPADFWALQWRNDQGEIEFNNQEPNQFINELPEWTTAIIAEHARLTEQALQPPPPPTPEEQFQEMKQQRNRMLANSDWTVIRHKDQQELELPTTLSDEVYKATLQWRQQLRDMPETLSASKTSTRAKADRPKWTWPPIPPELAPDFPDYPPDIRTTH